MAENENDKKPEKKRAAKYEDKLKVKGSFMDLIKASVKDAENKTTKKK